MLGQTYQIYFILKFILAAVALMAFQLFIKMSVKLKLIILLGILAYTYGYAWIKPGRHNQDLVEASTH